MNDKVQKIVSNLKDVLDDLGITSPHRLPIIEAIEYLQEEHVNEDLEEAAIQFATDTETGKVDIVKQSSFFWGAICNKQQMIAKAVDVTVHIDNGNYPYIPQIELYDYDKDIPLAREGDKYKVILIKED